MTKIILIRVKKVGISTRNQYSPRLKMSYKTDYKIEFFEYVVPPLERNVVRLKINLLSNFCYSFA